MLTVKRVYEAPAPTDGARFLVERLWPRGVRKDALAMAGWIKEIAPSDGLRRWFGHDPSKWDEFRRRYFEELDRNREALRPIAEAAAQGGATLLYSARDREHNSAVALAEYLARWSPPPENEVPHHRNRS
jgi:uncharacterized protein YeaO (DUF488 family)